MPRNISTARDWQATTAPGGAKADAATIQLRAYHLIKATEVERRLESLDHLERVAQDALGGGGLSLPLRAAFTALGLSVAKERATSKVRGFVKPAIGALGKTRVIDKHYWLEAMDPLHRPWGHLQAHNLTIGAPESGPQIFARWAASASTETFWEWCTRSGLDTYGLPSVQYLAPDQRWRYWVVFERTDVNDSSTGRLHQHDDTKNLQPFDTRALTTHFSGPGFAVFVVSPAGTFYSHNHVVSSFHHSTFLSGRQVLAAGEWAVFNGRILFLSHKTGHYKAGPDNLQNALKVLDRQTDLSDTLVEVDTFGAMGQTGLRYARASDLLAAGSPAGVAPLADAEVLAFLRRTLALDPTLRPITDRLFTRVNQAKAQGIWAL